jgi:hypothetical protein
VVPHKARNGDLDFDDVTAPDAQKAIAVIAWREYATATVASPRDLASSADQQSDRERA